ncbi:MAG: hypothetical protein K2H63_09275 [Paramuribaculum sp.]|nr:hypothetical protein [Paramuribaculum sp.]
MKRNNVLALMSAAVIGLGFSSCEAMLDSSLDVPLGYGSSLGVSVSNYIPLVNSWNNYGYGLWNGGGWYPGTVVRPVVAPIRPAQRPGVIAPPVPPAPPVNNWRPPVNNNTWRPPVNNVPSNPAPERPGNSNISYRPVNSMPQIPANTNNPKPATSVTTKPGRH